MRRTRAISYPISVLVAATLGLAALPACTTQNTVVDAAVDAPVLVSEGCDTPITVEGYTDLNSDAFHFLEQGDKIAVITPSSLPTMEQFEATMAGLEAWGYVPVAGNHVDPAVRTIDDCVEDLTWALSDPEIKAIFCVRGGYGSSEVLDLLPLSLIEQANKPIIGYSDITTFHAAWTREGVSSIHACMSATFIDLTKESVEVEQRVLKGEAPRYRVGGSDYDVEGSAEGTLIGGNLATLTSVLDTAYDCTATDGPYILFLEDVSEDYNHIHRFLTILDHQGVLDRAAGIIFGEWVDYPAEREGNSGSSRGGDYASVADMISRRFLRDGDIPVAFGFPAGHGDTNYPLIMGKTVRLDVRKDGYTLEWLEPSA